jgi:Rrf2 family protein
MSKVVHISEAASLAVHSMAIIASGKAKLNVGQIAAFTGSSKNHLAKVLQILVKNDYLYSNRGPKGGFVLKADAGKVSLLEIYELIEGTIEKCHCGITEKKCPFINCVFGDLSDKFSADFIAYLSNTKIADIKTKL